MAVSFLTRLITVLVVIVVILQLIHLLLLNKLESERLLELQRFHKYSSSSSDSERFQISAAMSSTEEFKKEQQSSSFLLSKLFKMQHKVQKQSRSNANTERNVNGYVNKHESAGIGKNFQMDSSKKYFVVSNVNQLLKEALIHNSNKDQVFSAADDKNKFQSVLNNNQDEDFTIDNENDIQTSVFMDNYLPTAASFQIEQETSTELDITMATYSKDLKTTKSHLIQLVERWLGPISLSLYIEIPQELNSTMEFINNVIQCNELVKTHVNIHLVFPIKLKSIFELLLNIYRENPGANILNYSNNNSNNNLHVKSKSSSRKKKKRIKKGKNFPTVKKSRCQKFYQSLQFSSSKHNEEEEEDYEIEADDDGQIEKEFSAKPEKSNTNIIPYNLLRNVARRNINSKYSLVCDVKLLPSESLRVKFQEFIKSKKNRSENTLINAKEEKIVYVVPAFEILERNFNKLPKHKHQLLSLLEKYEARPYSFGICWKCQVYTDYESWQRESSTSTSASNNMLSILIEILWKDPWEPFFISDNSIPFYNENLDSITEISTTSHSAAASAEAESFGSLSLFCELHLAGFKFAILNNAFLIHNAYRESSYASSSSGQNRISNNNAQQQNIYEDIKNQLQTIYSNTLRSCD